MGAMEDDFPIQSECSGDDLSDENYNDIPGENFVSMHRGIHDFDARSDLEDLLFFPTCEDLGLQSGRNKNDDDTNNSKQRFVEYFHEVGFDDDILLCKPSISSITSSDCNERDDGNFIDHVNQSPRYSGDDN